MTASQLKTQFFNLWGDIYSDFFDDATLSGILTKAYQQVVDDEIKVFIANKSNYENLQGLITTITHAPTSGSYDTKPRDYFYPVSIQLKYVTSDSPKGYYYNEAEMDRPGRQKSPNDVATPIRPRYKPEGNNIQFIATMPALSVTEITLTYIQAITAINITSAPSVSPLIPLNLQNKLLEYAVQECERIAGDTEGFGMETSQMNQ